MASKICFQVFVAVILLLQSVFSLKCYTCNSAKDEGCSASPPPEKYLIECSHDTMEILNDFHRQTKLEEAASAKHDHGHDHDDSEHGHEHHRHEMESMPAASTAPAPLLEDPSETTQLPDASTPAALANDRQARSVDANMNEPGSLITAAVKLPKEATFCRKNSYHIPEQVNGPDSKFESTIRIIRTCGWIAEEKKEGASNKTDCKWIVNAGTQIDQCVCTGDGCNAGSYLESLKSHTLILFAVITASFYYVL
ncbi:hypothetical protein Ocin01_00347 [Orchesella cincta]|uniref:Uncharacterized protein n=1 Tax=Orchesella cincta TaxID=48709 RepID=A0A1D2NMI4_ORCCI|nr:hypothetical protein Ocin01_00347 [Orchesella cincta]